MAEHVAHVEYQVTPTGPVQRARPNHAEVSDQGAIANLLLDGADQMVVIGQIFVDYRCSGLLAMIDQQIGSIALNQLDGRTRLAATLKGLRIFQNILGDPIEMGQHLFMTGPALLQFTHRTTERELKHFLVKPPHLAASFLAQARQLTDNLLQFFSAVRQFGP